MLAWVEGNIEQTLTYYRLPLAHHKHMKSTNMLERFNQELSGAPMWCAFSPMRKAACG